MEVGDLTSNKLGRPTIETITIYCGAWAFCNDTLLIFFIDGETDLENVEDFSPRNSLFLGKHQNLSQSPTWVFLGGCLQKTGVHTRRKAITETCSNRNHVAHDAHRLVTFTPPPSHGSPSLQRSEAAVITRIINLIFVTGATGGAHVNFFWPV